MTGEDRTRTSEPRLTSFERAYGGPGRAPHAQSPELALIQCLSIGDGDGAAAVMAEHRPNGELPVIRTPWGDFTGPSGVGELARSWCSRFGAARLEVSAVAQTQAGGRSVSEIVLRQPGGQTEIPVTVVADLVFAENTVDDVRVYLHHGWTDDLEPYRAPVFTAVHNAPASSALLTGVVRRYYEQLHRPGEPDASREGILVLFAEGFHYGGYKPPDLEPLTDHPARIRDAFGHICAVIPSEQYIRFETIIDDGFTCCAEWTSVPTPSGAAKGVRAQAGFAAYDRAPGGLLKAVRVNDNFGPPARRRPSS